MAQQTINVGTTANDGTGDALRNAFIKANDNFTELYTNRISGSGTDNYIPRFNGTNALENSIIFDNGTNVGIGTSSPTSKLEIRNAGSDTVSNILTLGQTNLAGTDDSRLNISCDANNNLVNFISTGTNLGGFTFNSGGTERMRITSAGNVGIGTSSPEVKLDIYGTGTTQHRIQSSSGGDIRFSVDSVGRLGTYSNSDFLLLSNSTERMRINTLGEVLVGQTSAIYSATNRANLTIGKSAGSILVLGTSTASNGYLFFDTTNVELANSTASGSVLFRTAGTERMRITSGGNVYIGKTSGSSKFGISGLPTSSAGLSSGDIWNDGGTLKIV
jgi:hypothetical protein